MRHHRTEPDVIIGGAGYAGCVSARLLAEQGQRVLLVEKHGYLGGHSRDSYDEAGVLVHDFGPHLFHTTDKRVWEFLSRFTRWRPYEHRVKGLIDGHLVPIPFNFTTLETLLPDKAPVYAKKLLGLYGEGSKVPVLELRQATDHDLRALGDFVYEKIFLHYTMKMWDKSPEDIDQAVTARVPVLLSRDDRYFQDPYQALPLEGYTTMFESMVDHPNISVLLNSNFADLVTLKGSTIPEFENRPFRGRLIYTGPLDALLDFRHGDLPYRSLRLEFQTHLMDRYQEAATINFPDDRPATRISEFKLMTGQDLPGLTTTLTEYPQAYDRHTPGMDTPYYPVFTDQGKAAYAAYRSELDQVPGMTLLGRLAEYRYYDMAVVVQRVLEEFG